MKDIGKSHNNNGYVISFITKTQDNSHLKNEKAKYIEMRLNI